MKILAIESSCDETAAAVVENGRTVLSNIVASQVDEHALYGGVVPEIASRRHAESISAVVTSALVEAGCGFADLDGIAVTYAPGLIGCLLVGVNYAKGLALSTGLPLIPVHHLRSHVAANYLCASDLKPPFLCLIVSGGHSHIVFVEDYTKFRVLGKTRDDAVGECYDKVARTLGLPYPGGIYLDRLAPSGDENAFVFPKPKVDGSAFDFSFSGLKTAVINTVHNKNQKGEGFEAADIAASFQKTAMEILASHVDAALDEVKTDTVVMAGGVAANSELRKQMKLLCERRGKEFFVPELKFCGDNAAMVGAQAYYEFLANHTAGMDLNAVATLNIE